MVNFVITILFQLVLITVCCVMTPQRVLSAWMDIIWMQMVHVDVSIQYLETKTVGLMNDEQ